MNLEIFRKEDQVNGQFNGGAILEKKPLGFPNDGGKLKAYSNLLYWSHAWSENGSTIGEHPHQGFEIISIVINGEIKHYDNKIRMWKNLSAGDAQLIQAGNGVSHSERFEAGSSVFQIWLDPNLQRSINKEAKYQDFSSEKFPIINGDSCSRKVYIGPGSPMHVDAENVCMYEVFLQTGLHSMEFDVNQIHSIFILEGELEINNTIIKQHDFFTYNGDRTNLNVLSDVRFFQVSNPVRTTYRTYAEQYM